MVSTQQQTTVDILDANRVPVAQFSLPDGWMSATAPDRPGYFWISRFYASPEQEGCGFYLRVPAKRTYFRRAATENPFLKLLSQPAHELDEEEFLAIHLLLEHVSWPARFQRDSAKTIYVEPFNVLEVEGTWLEQGLKARGIIMDTSRMSAAFVQEFWFVCDPARFEETRGMVDEVLGSIAWSQAVAQDLQAQAS